MAEAPKPPTWGNLPVPTVNFPGDPFTGKQPYGYGVGFPGAGFGIGSKGIEVFGQTFAFSGPSPKAKTTSVGDKLIANADPVLKKLGFQLLNAEKSGIFTSSSNPAAQKVLSGFFDQAVQGLKGQFGFSQKQAAQYVSDLISKSATGAALSKKYEQLIASQPVPLAPLPVLPPPIPAPAPPAALPAPAPPVVHPPSPNSPPAPQLPAPQPPAPPPALPAPQAPYTYPAPPSAPLPIPPYQPPVAPGMSFSTSADQFTSQFARKALPLVGSFVGGSVGYATGEAVPFIGPQIGEAVGSYFGEQGGQYLANTYFPGPQTGLGSPQTPQPISPYPPTGQYGQVPQNPVAPLLQPCPECGYNPAPIIAQQEQQVRQEIQREQAQLQQQTLQQTQQELNRLQQLESQPVSTRNIQQELQQKQQIQQTLQQLEQGQGGGFPQSSGETPNTGGQPLAPLLDYQTPYTPPAPGSSAGGGQPVLISSQPTQGAQPTTPVGFQQGTPGPDGVPHPLAPGQVKFCVVCSSQNESLKFLNGEPSECSVLAS